MRGVIVGQLAIGVFRRSGNEKRQKNQVFPRWRDVGGARIGRRNRLGRGFRPAQAFDHRYPKETRPTQEKPPPAKKKSDRGFQFEPRRDAVHLSCGRRNPLFYVGEPITFTLGPSAASYEVRDYRGELVDQGPAGQSITLNVKQPGWYKLYVYGKDSVPLWGKIVGGMPLVVLRNNWNFPQLPSAEKFPTPAPPTR